MVGEMEGQRDRRTEGREDVALCQGSPITFPALVLGSKTLHASSECFPHPWLASAERGAAEGCWRWERSWDVAGPQPHGPMSPTGGLH